MFSPCVHNTRVSEGDAHSHGVASCTVPAGVPDAATSAVVAVRSSTMKAEAYGRRTISGATLPPTRTRCGLPLRREVAGDCEGRGRGEEGGGMADGISLFLLGGWGGGGREVGG